MKLWTGVWIHWYYSHIDTKWWYCCDTEWSNSNINFNNSGQSSDHVSSSCLFKTEDNCWIYSCFALYQSSSECSGSTDDIFIYINESFFFLTDLLGYMNIW
jgi:hypothetical protein